jgi:hypothetical protein
MLFNLYMDCVIRHVVPTIKFWAFHTIDGALHEVDPNVLGQGDFVWIL